jgi:hypothetical protein
MDLATASATLGTFGAEDLVADLAADLVVLTQSTFALKTTGLMLDTEQVAAGGTGNGTVTAETAPTGDTSRLDDDGRLDTTGWAKTQTVCTVGLKVHRIGKVEVRSQQFVTVSTVDDAVGTEALTTDRASFKLAAETVTTWTTHSAAGAEQVAVDAVYS